MFPFDELNNEPECAVRLASWNEYRSTHKGEGMSPTQMSAGYQAQKSRSSSRKATLDAEAPVVDHRILLSEKKPKKNKGEAAEVQCVQTILAWDQNGHYDKLTKLFGPDAREGVAIHDLATRVEITDAEALTKTASGSKADCSFRMRDTGRHWDASIKCLDGGKPSILNHTNRAASVWSSGGELHQLLPDLDSIVDIYNQKRSSGAPEEIMLSTLDSVTSELRESMIELISYFMFTGTGRGRSRNPANCLITISDGEYRFEPLGTKEQQNAYVAANYENFEMSLVSRKGMNKFRWKDEAEKAAESCKVSREKFELIKPWVFETSDGGKKNPDKRIKLKGALHIRLRRIR